VQRSSWRGGLGHEIQERLGDGLTVSVTRKQIEQLGPGFTLFVNRLLEAERAAQGLPGANLSITMREMIPMAALTLS
jgi:hypothetical protein